MIRRFLPKCISLISCIINIVSVSDLEMEST